MQTKELRASQGLFGIFEVFADSIVICPRTGLLWDIGDTFNGLMVIPNLVGLLFLGVKARDLLFAEIQKEK